MPVADISEARRTREDKLEQHRGLLLESVERHVLPRFIELGFVVTDPWGGVDRDLAEAFPLGLLRRSRRDGGLDLAEIQFMTLHRAAFRINACAVPKGGMMTVGGHKSTDELEAGGLHDHFEMYASPRWRRWFSIPFWRLRRPDKCQYEKLALHVASMLSEVELALREGRLGPHMREITYQLG